MLVLTRKLGERIEIAGGEIVVKLVEIRGDKVRLGITAPPGVPVYREEVAELAAGRDPGFVIDSSRAGHPIAPTVLALARGPTQGESAAAWLDRMSKWRQLVDDGGEQREDQPRPPPSSWRATRGYVAAEWPADRKR